jgi:hypothetical protein
MIKEFLNNPSQQKFIADALDLLAEIAASAATEKGFHEDEEQILQSIARVTQLEQDKEAYLKQTQWAQGCILQAELARQMSEIAEAVEAVRKPGPDHHLPEFSNFLVEEADAIIRICDTVGKRKLPIGRVVVAKMLYNLSRPHKHGKLS